MILTTEVLGDFLDVNELVLDEVLLSDGFGKFTILAASEVKFIQAANDWQPGEVCQEFLRIHDSDPWWLEYREGEQQFRASSHATLEQVRKTFQAFLVNDLTWRTWFVWEDLAL